MDLELLDIDLRLSRRLRELGRPLGHFIFSLIGFKRIIFRKFSQRLLRAILGKRNLAFKFGVLGLPGLEGFGCLSRCLSQAVLAGLR